MPPEPSTADIAAALRSRLMSYGGAAPPGTPNLDMIQMLEQAAQQPQPQRSYTNYDYQPLPQQIVRPSQPQGGCVNYGYQSPPLQHTGVWPAHRGGNCLGTTAQTQPPVWHKASPSVRPPQTPEVNGVVATTGPVATKGPEDLAAALSNQLMNPGGTPSVELIEALARAAQLPDSDYPHIAPVSTPPTAVPTLMRVEGPLDPLAGTTLPARENSHATNGITMDESGSAGSVQGDAAKGVAVAAATAAPVAAAAAAAAATTMNSNNGPDMQTAHTTATEFGDEMGQGNTVVTDPYTQGVGNAAEILQEEEDQFKRPLESSQQSASLQTPAVTGSSLAHAPVPSLTAPSPFPMSTVQSPLTAGHVDVSQSVSGGRIVDDSKQVNASPATHDLYAIGPLANGNTDTMNTRRPTAANQSDACVSHGSNTIMEASVTHTQHGTHRAAETAVDTTTHSVSLEAAAAVGTQAPVEMMTQQLNVQAQNSFPGAAAINMRGMNGGQHTTLEASAQGGPDVGGGQEVPPKLDGTVGIGMMSVNGDPLTVRPVAGPAHGIYRYDLSPKDDVDACLRNIRRRIEVELDDGCTVQMYLQMAKGR